MSNDTSATVSDDENDQADAWSDDESNAGKVSSSRLERVDNRTSEQVLTLKDEPNDFLITRVRRDDEIANENEEDDDEDDEPDRDETEERRKAEKPAPKVAESDLKSTVPAQVGVPSSSASQNATPSKSNGASSTTKPTAISTTTQAVLTDGKPRVQATIKTDPLKDSQAAQATEADKAAVVAGGGITTTVNRIDKRVRRKRKNLWICLENCKYDVVHRMAKKYGFKVCDVEEDWNLYWTDLSVGLERVMDMKRYQKINHFPGMSELCRKDLLARNLNKMMKLFPKEYGFFPNTWVLPADFGELLTYSRSKKRETYIIKPPASCQGRGIWLTKNPNRIKANEHAVVQTYLRKPFLVDGFKFDLRVYVTITSCDPLRIFVFKDGLARFATCKYVDPTSNNCDNMFMHVTNYAVQKTSDNYVDDEETGTKRRISTINRWLRDNGYNVDKLWQDIDDIAIKTIISAQPVLRHNYRTCFPNHVQGSACFEVLGFDIVLDRKLRPYVLEVNHSPSFTTDAQIDLDIKEVLIYDTLDLINICGVDRKKVLEDDKRRVKERLLQKQSKKDLQEEIEREAEAWVEEQEKYEAEHLGNYRRIYPIPGLTEKYDKYFQNSGSLFAETAAFRARQECARQQREDLTRKQEQLQLMKKNKDRTLRPESPDRPLPRRPLIRRPPLPQKRLSQANSDDSSGIDSGLWSNSSLSRGFVMDIMKPVTIVDEEEVARLSGLIQRENMIRSLGVVEQVYRLLHGTSGTMGNVKPVPPAPAQNNTASLHNRIVQAQYPRLAVVTENDGGFGVGVGFGFGVMKGLNKSTSTSTSDVGRGVVRPAVAQLHLVGTNPPETASTVNEAQWRAPPKVPPNLERRSQRQKRVGGDSAGRRPQAAPALVSLVGTERTELPLGVQMEKLLALQTLDSVLPPSLQNPLRQSTLPLQSSDLIQYRHQSTSSANASPLLQIRKRAGSASANPDGTELEDPAAQNRYKNYMRRASVQMSPGKLGPAAMDWSLGGALSAEIGLQLKGLSLKAPGHP